MSSEKAAESDYEKIVNKVWENEKCDTGYLWREHVFIENTVSDLDLKREMKVLAKQCVAELDRIRNEEREKEREELRAQIEADIKNLEKREPGAPYFIAQISGLRWVLSLPYFASQKLKAEEVK